jgi:large subunit ribosomal protein L16
MLQPKRQKFRKEFRGRMKGLAQTGNSVAFGDYGVKCLGRGWLTARQIEAARKAITHYTKRSGKMWIRVFPNKPTTQKGLGVGMGGGKGEPEEFVFVAKPGRIIFELSGVPEDIAQEAFRRAGHKLPFKTAFVTKATDRL